MLLPFWTDGCIGSMEGLFFEASGTTPYHFLTAAALSQHSVQPGARACATTTATSTRASQYLQTLGVKYYLAFSPSIVTQADANPNLHAGSPRRGPWNIYEVAGHRDSSSR